MTHQHLNESQTRGCYLLYRSQSKSICLFKIIWKCIFNVSCSHDINSSQDSGMLFFFINIFQDYFIYLNKKNISSNIFWSINTSSFHKNWKKPNIMLLVIKYIKQYLFLTKYYITSYSVLVDMNLRDYWQIN